MKEIQLTQGKVAYIDDDDFDRVSKYKWRAYKCRYTYYAITRYEHTPPYSQVSLHRFLMDCDKDKVVDHIDGDGLNNQKSNLRIVSIQQNCSNRINLMKNNTSGYRGVYWKLPHKRWNSCIRFKGKLFYIGNFNTPEEAARAYDKKAKELFGEYCGKLNFPD
jgi:hypothetical protein